MSPTPHVSSQSGVQVQRAKFAVYVLFFVIGFVFANWASRLPAVRDALHYEPAQMGRLLLVGAVGSVIALPVSGWINQRLGSKRAIQCAMVLFAGGYLLVALSVGQLPIVVTAVGLFVGGVGMGICDTSMNLEGASVERVLGQSIMPRFHGAFSLGTMAGALIGAAVAHFGVAVAVHVSTAVVAGFAAIMVAVLSLLPSEHNVAVVQVGPDSAILPDHAPTSDHADMSDYAPTPDHAVMSDHAPAPGQVSALSLNDSGASPQPQPSIWSAWRSGRTWLIGVIVLAAALTEGAANDWLALGIVDGFGVNDSFGAFGLFVFLSAMTAGRFVGTRILDQCGRLVVLRLCAVFALIGLILFGLAPWMWLALVGAALWGVGASLGFPIGMSAASDDPRTAAARLSVVATIGYTAFFAGPPLLGELATHIGYRHAMLAIMIPAIVGLLVSGAAKEDSRASATHNAAE